VATTLVRSLLGACTAIAWADASIGDPLKLGSDPGVSGVIVEAEPVAVEGATWTTVKSMFGARGR
jgi:hypothetical protein